MNRIRMKHIAWTMALALACTLAAAPAEATKKKKPSGGSAYSSGSGHSSHSSHSSGSRGAATAIGLGVIGYGISGGMQQAVGSTPDHRCTSMNCRDDDWWERQYMRDNIRTRTPEELKQLRAIAKQRQNTPEHRAHQDAEAGRETMNLFLGLGAGALGFGR